MFAISSVVLILHVIFYLATLTSISNGRGNTGRGEEIEYVLLYQCGQSISIECMHSDTIIPQGRFPQYPLRRDLKMNNTFVAISRDSRQGGPWLGCATDIFSFSPCKVH